ncbi:hypothetical protein GCM10009736_04960 [Actinomadura bangladeshensis]
MSANPDRLAGTMARRRWRLVLSAGTVPSAPGKGRGGFGGFGSRNDLHKGGVAAVQNPGPRAGFHVKRP